MEKKLYARERRRSRSVEKRGGRSFNVLERKKFRSVREEDDGSKA